MRNKLFLGIILCFFLVFSPLVQGQMCGDVNGDLDINISDLVYLINWGFMYGPEPVSLTDANMDNCSGIDINDMMYLCSYLFAGGPAPCTFGAADCSYANGGFVLLDHVDGEIAPGVLALDVPITFHIRYVNNTGNNVKGIVNGFTVSSPEGATWSSTAIDTTSAMGFSTFDLFAHPGNINTDGVGIDTVSATGITLALSGLSDGFSEIGYTITIGPLSSTDFGKHIVLDSTSFYPIGCWKWSVDGYSSYYPNWNGPYNFVIGDSAIEPESGVSISGIEGYPVGTTVLPTGEPITFNINYNNTYGYTCDILSNGFEVYSPDGAVWGSTAGSQTGVFTTDMFNAGIFINPINVNGMDYDTIGFGAVNMTGAGMPDGFSGDPFQITIGAIDPIYAGKMICIDSCWYPPINNWLWGSLANPDLVPDWNGPYCYTIESSGIEEYYLNLSSDTFFFNTLVGGQMNFNEVLLVSEINGGNIPYSATDDASWLSLGFSAGTTPWPMEVHVDASGLAAGVYYATITVTSDSASNSPQYTVAKLTITEPSQAAILLDNVYGELEPGYIRTGIPVTFNFRYINTTDGNVRGMTNGYQVYSPDGAEWVTTVGDTLGGLGLEMFDLVYVINYFGVTGSGVDTVGTGGASIFADGLEAGYNDVAFSLTVGPIDSIYAGKTICIDSVFFPPTGYWLWNTVTANDFPPDWYGPYCFEIMYSDEPPPPPPGDDSLLIPSTAFYPGYGIQPVAVKLTEPIKGATIPIAIPDGVEVLSITTDSTIVSTWDYKFTYIKPDSGFLFVALANSFGATIPVGTSHIFNINYIAGNNSCDYPAVIQWDTTLSGDVSRQLTFSDTTAHPLYPRFDIYRDTTIVLPVMPGDFNVDDNVDIVDLVATVDYMFEGGIAPISLNTIDVNADCVGPDIADLVYLVDYMFVGGPAPQCGCIVGATIVTAKINPEINLYTYNNNGYTFVELNSPDELRGIQFELVGNGGDTPVLLTSSNLDLIHGEQNGVVKVGLLDLDGANCINSGKVQLIKIPGEYNLISATVADKDKNSFTPMINSKPNMVPENFELYQNYPNPFNPNTEISFSLPESAETRLVIYNIMGQKVTTLVNTTLEAGWYTYQWNADNVSSGIYFYRLEAGKYSETKKMMLLK